MNVAGVGREKGSEYYEYFSCTMCRGMTGGEASRGAEGGTSSDNTEYQGKRNAK